MKKDNKMSFEDKLDLIQVIEKAAKKDFGEDSFYCAQGVNSALISVCDGCGGLGARRYETFQGHTGAYIAARTVTGAIHDWYHKYYTKSWKDSCQMANSMMDYINQAYKVCEPYTAERMRIRGSMVRKLPTTLALAYAEDAGDRVLVHSLWAGDSRVYLLDDRGLAQLTIDDTDVADALENIYYDGAMTNVLSSDEQYQINSKTIYLNRPALIFATTDGCFGYVPSPMEFEYIILNALVKSETPERFKEKLYRQFSQYAGDDFAFGIMSFGFLDYQNTRRVLKPRLQYLEENYMSHITCEHDEKSIRRLWREYKGNYERYLI